jgi:hypothetical protein
MNPVCGNCLYYAEDGCCQKHSAIIDCWYEALPCESWTDADGTQEENLQARCEHLERALRLACHYAADWAPAHILKYPNVWRSPHPEANAWQTWVLEQTQEQSVPVQGDGHSVAGMRIRITEPEVEAEDKDEEEDRCGPTAS